MPKQPSLSVVVPAYNEEENISTCASSLIKVLDKVTTNYELLLVDNGSTDKTSKKIDLLKKHNPHIKKVSIKTNRGYGFGVRKGIENARGKYAGWIDADNQVDAEFIADIYRKIKRENYDIVIARRKLRDECLSRRIASFFYNTLVSTLFFTNLRDINAKPKIFKKSAYDESKMLSDDWFIDTELLLKFKTKKKSVAVIDCISKERAHGKSNVTFRTVYEFFKNIVLFRLGVR